MGIRLSLAERVSRYIKAAGKRSILETKPIHIKGKSFVPKKQYDIEFNKRFSFYGQNCESQIPETFIKQTTKRELNEEIKTWGRILRRGEERQNVFNFTEQTSDSGIDPICLAMSITSKQRAIEVAKTDANIAKRLNKHPELFALSAEEANAKKLLDKTFMTIKPNEFDSIAYRGVVLDSDSPFYKKLLSLKRGEIYTEPGYIWTTPSSAYAFGRYADKTGLGSKKSIKYTILNPVESIEMRMQGHSRENLMPFNSKFKVHDLIKDFEGNIELFVEHIF